MSAAATLGMATALGAVVLCLHLLERALRDGRLGGGEKPVGTRWASRGDLKALRVQSPQPGRIVLGRQGRGLLAAEDRASVVVVGPSTVSYKTTGLAIPAILEWPGPVVCTSVKSDLLAATLDARSKVGTAMVFDPANVTAVPSVQATPLVGCTTWRGSMRMAHWLSTSARAAGDRGLEDAEFWHAAAEKLLAPLLYAAGRNGGEMERVIDWLNAGKEADEEVSDLLTRVPESDKALNAWNANMKREERQLGSIYTTAETILGAFHDPRVLEVTQRADYTPDSLLDGNSNTLYLCAPANEQERLRTLFAAMLSELSAAVYEKAAGNGKPIATALLMVLDEAANVAPIPNLDVIASTGAGQGIQLVTVFQDLAQVQSRYGKAAQTIVNNHRAKVFASGIGDPETLRHVGLLVGEGEFREQSQTKEKEGRSSSTERSAFRDLAPVSVVRGSRPGHGLLVYGHLPPARLRLRPWFSEPALKALVEEEFEDER